MPLPHNFADLYREAPVFAVCGAVYFACDIFLPNEGWPALLRPLFLALLLIPCARYLWRTRRHDRLGWRYQYPPSLPQAPLSSSWPRPSALISLAAAEI